MTTEPETALQGFVLRALNLALIAAVIALVALRFDLNLLWVLPLLAMLSAMLFTTGRYLVLVARTIRSLTLSGAKRDMIPTTLASLPTR